MLTLDSEQAARARSSHLAKVDLVTLTQGATTVRLAGVGVRFDGALYEPFLSKVIPAPVSINHLPSPDDLGSLTQPLDVELSNEPRAGSRVYEYLETQMGGTIEGATLEWSQVLTASRPTGAFWDLSALGSAERTVRWRGHVRQSGPVQNDLLRLRGEVDQLAYDWPVATHADTDPRDYGVRLPVVFGNAQRVHATRYIMPARTLLLNDLTEGETGAFSVDARGANFPASFSCWIGTEEISCTKTDSQTFEIVAREQSGTTAAVHLKSDSVVEHVGAVFILAAHEASQVAVRYGVTPLGELLPFGHGTVDLEDTTTIPGRTVSTLTLTADEVTDLGTILTAHGALQATEGTSGGSTVTEATDTTAAKSFGGLGWTSASSTLTWTNSVFDNGAIWKSWAGAMDSTNEVIRWRAKVTVSWANKAGAFRGAIQHSFTSLPGNPPANHSHVIDTGDPTSGSYQYVSDWVDQPAGIYLDALRTASSRVAFTMNAYVSSDVGSLTFTMGTTEIEADLDSSGTPATIDSIPTGGYDLDVFADVAGYGIPATEPGDFATVYEFDNRTDFSINSGIGGRTITEDTGDPNSGSTAFKCNLPDPVEELSMDGEASNWVPGGGSPESDTTFTDVSAGVSGYDEPCVKLENTDTFTDDGFPLTYHFLSAYYDLTSSPIDCTDKFILLDIKVEITGGSSHTDMVRVSMNHGGSSQTAYFSSDGTSRNGRTGHSSRGWLGNNVWQTIVLGYNADVDYISIVPLGEEDDHEWQAGEFAMYVGRIRSVDVGDYLTNPTLTATGISPTMDLVSDSGSVALSAKMVGDFPTVWPVSGPGDIDVELYWSGGADSPASATPRHYTTASAIQDVAWTRTEAAQMTEGSPTHADVVDSLQVVFKFDALGVNEYIHAGLYEGGGHVLVDTFETQEVITIDDPYFSEQAPDGELNPVVHPFDVLRYWLETVLGVMLDIGHWTDVLKVDVEPGLLMAGDLRTAGLDALDVTARIAFEAGANLVPTFTATGVQWRILAPRTGDLSWTKGATLAALTQWDRAGIAQAGRSIDADIFTRYAFLYAPNHAFSSSEEPYTGLLVANPTVSDVTGVETATLAALETDIGLHVASPMAFQLLDDAYTAAIIAGYYVAEQARLAKLFALVGVPWWEAYDVEVGDLLAVTPPWSATEVNCRVISIRVDPSTEQRELRLVEVT